MAAEAAAPDAGGKRESESDYTAREVCDRRMRTNRKKKESVEAAELEDVDVTGELDTQKSQHAQSQRQPVSHTPLLAE